MSHSLTKHMLAAARTWLVNTTHIHVLDHKICFDWLELTFASHVLAVANISLVKFV